MQEQQTQSQSVRAHPKVLYDVRETAEVLSLSERSIWNLIAKRELTPTRIGGRVLISWNELLRFVEEKTVRIAEEREAVPA
jgi:excisionase family DNA binding protein